MKDGVPRLTWLNNNLMGKIQLQVCKVHSNFPEKRCVGRTLRLLVFKDMVVWTPSATQKVNVATRIV